jgi:hypothetical protein
MNPLKLSLVVVLLLTSQFVHAADVKISADHRYTLYEED